MSVGQELLLRRPLTERFAPLVSARVPLFGPITDCPGGRGRRSQVVAANLLNQTFSRTSKRRRDQRKTDRGDREDCRVGSGLDQRRIVPRENAKERDRRCDIR